MAKTRKPAVARNSKPRTKQKPNINAKTMTALVENASLIRSGFLTKLLDDRRDIDVECGYDKTISSEQYQFLYDREGIARRVVAVFPEESWAVEPEVIETEDSELTPFEQAWKDLQDERHIWHYMHRIDELSGVGEFGIMMLGLDDGKKLSVPVTAGDHKLIYIHTYDQSIVTIKSKETDPSSPRYGLPTIYTIMFEDVTTGGSQSSDVHWSRIIHVADNRCMSEVLGTPRLQPVYNRMYDMRKLLGGSAEMFWKGAFPGYALEINPNVPDATIDADSVRETMEDYQNGLQRYLALIGVNVKSLSPQVADPTGHIDVQLKAVAISLSIPVRILFGSEQAKLASTQDSRTWNKRVAKRQTGYLTPMLIRPFIDRMIEFGVLPQPAKYKVVWPDLNTQTDKDKADVAKTRAEALAIYVKGSVDQIIPPSEFLTIIMDMDVDEVATIMSAAGLYIDEADESELEENA